MIKQYRILDLPILVRHLQAWCRNSSVINSPCTRAGRRCPGCFAGGEGCYRCEPLQ